MVESGRAEREGGREEDADGEETLNPQYNNGGNGATDLCYPSLPSPLSISTSPHFC